MKKNTNDKTGQPTAIPFEFYCIAIGILGATDEFSAPMITPMLPDVDTCLRIEQDLKVAGLFDEDGLPCFENIHKALNTLREYLANAPTDRFDDFNAKEPVGDCDEMEEF